MSFYFSTYKKKKLFPFSVFGYIAVLVWTGLIIYFFNEDYTFSDVIGTGSRTQAINLVGFSIIVSSFLLFFLNLGISREIKSKFKFPLYLMQFLFLLISAFSGYYFISDIFGDLVKYFIIIGALNSLTLIIYFIIQQRIYSKYNSIPIMIISSFPLIPFTIWITKILLTIPIELSASGLSFDNMVLYVLLFTLLLCTLVNSIYLSYINRRVF